MRIGVPTEIKSDEYRVALTPAGVRELTGHGHDVIVQAKPINSGSLFTNLILGFGLGITTSALEVAADAGWRGSHAELAVLTAAAWRMRIPEVRDIVTLARRR